MMPEPIRLIYVDDEPALLQIGKRFLEMTGEFAVTTAERAGDAIQIHAEQPYDAIISDYQMPGMDGLEFLKHVRATGDSTPFIIFTGRGREEVVIQALNEGADFYLQKGGDPKSQFAELSNKVRYAVQRRRAEASIRDHERREADIINFLPDATFAIDRAGTVIAWNRAMEEMTGVPASEILGKGDYEYAIPFYHERRPILIDLVFSPEEEIRSKYRFLEFDHDCIMAETTNATPLGKSVILWGKAIPLYNQRGEIVGAIESIRDVTERNRTEHELRAAHEQLTASEEELRSQYEELAVSEQRIRESEEQYHNVVEDQTEFISRFRPDGTHVFVNGAYCRYFGLERGKVLGHRFRADIPAEDRDLVRAFFASLTPDHPTDIIEHRIIMPDGTVRWQRWSVRAIFDASGAVTEYQSVGRDITDKKEAEEKLRQSEERFRVTQEMSPDGFTILHPVRNKEGEIVDFAWIYENPTIARLNGTDPQKVIGKRLLDLFPTHNGTPVFEAYIHVANTGNPQIIEEVFIGEIISRPRWLRLVIISMGEDIAILAQDITDRKRAEEALQTVNKKLQFLSGITRHDIVNQILSLRAYLNLTMQRIDDPTVSGYIAGAEKAAAAIEKQIGFTRVYEEIGVTSPAWHSIDAIIQTIDASRLPIRHDCEDFSVYADPMFERVFHNLYDNTIRHAEGASGVWVRCEEEDDGPGKQDGGLVITWEDDGEGIAAADRPRLFDRGFGKNNGFGLFLAREILAITGITITETGEPGKGARFEIHVPEGGYRSRDMRV